MCRRFSRLFRKVCCGTRDAARTFRSTSVSNTPVDLRFCDVAGHDHVLHATTPDGHGWHVRAFLARGIFTRHCHSWQAVERTVSWLRRHAHENVPARQSGPAAPTAAVLACLMVMGTTSWAQVRPPADDAVAVFTAATHQYAVTHRRIEQQLPPMVVNADPAEIYRAIEQMAAAMKAARPNARQGDFFTPALAPLLRSRITTSLHTHGFTREDVRLAEMAEGIDSTTVTLRVNGRFPWIFASPMFPCVLAALPAVPPELQYRIVGDNLVLVDVHAGLVVDLLPDALRGPVTTDR
jgi:hypothetical protein